jgi:hypothetical protein
MCRARWRIRHCIVDPQQSSPPGARRHSVYRLWWLRRRLWVDGSAQLGSCRHQYGDSIHVHGGSADPPERQASDRQRGRTSDHSDPPEVEEHQQNVQQPNDGQDNRDRIEQPDGRVRGGRPSSEWCQGSRSLDRRRHPARRKLITTEKARIVT